MRACTYRPFEKSVHFLIALAGLVYFFDCITPEIAKRPTLDEYGSFWYISGSWGELFDKSFYVQGQAPFYYMVLKLWSGLAGPSVAAARILSLGFATLTVFAVAYFGTLLKIRTAELISGLFLLLTGGVLLSTAIRPYPLAGLLSVLSFIALISFLQEGSRQLTFWAYCATTLLIPLTHPLYLIGLIPQLYYLSFSYSRRTNQLIAAVLVIVLALILSLVLLVRFGTRVSIIKYSAPLDLSMLPLTMLISLTVLISSILLIRRSDGAAKDLRIAVFLASIGLLPGLTFLLGEYVMGSTMFLARYYGQLEFVLPLQLSHFITLWQSRFRALVCCVVWTICWVVFVMYREQFTGSENVRTVITPQSSAAVFQAERECELFSATGYIESQDISLLEDPAFRGFLAFPLVTNGFKPAQTLLPLIVDTRALEEYVLEKIAYVTGRGRCVLYIGSLPMTYLERVQRHGIEGFLSQEFIARRYHETRIEIAGSVVRVYRPADSIASSDFSNQSEDIPDRT